MTITAVVQARMGSTRLPGKVMTLLGGKPLIEVLLHRLAKSTRITTIVVATTENSLDDPLVAQAEALGYRVFRGSEPDVLSRFYLAVESQRPDIVVRITGDCPLVDASLVDAVIDAYVAGGVEYASNTNPPTYPDGLDVEVFSFAALAEAHRDATSRFDREHVTPFLRTSGRFRTLNVTAQEDWSAERWTVDEPRDLEVVSAVFDYFAPRVMFGWQEALTWLQAHPEVSALNRAIPRNEGSIVKPPSVSIRRATADDARRLYDWRNEDGMRRASFHGERIDFESHYAWLLRTLVNPERWLFIAELPDHTPVGYIRFDEVGTTAEISVTVDVAHRGRGLGPVVTRSAVSALHLVRPDLVPVALVKAENTASLKSFQDAGFSVVGDRPIDGARAVELRCLAVQQKDCHE